MPAVYSLYIINKSGGLIYNKVHCEVFYELNVLVMMFWVFSGLFRMFFFL